MLENRRLTTLLLIRHAQTVLNKEQRYQGHMDTPLSDVGAQQARRLAERLAGESIAAIYSSDLARCLDTAAPVASVLGLSVSPLATLREASYGRWEGMTFAAVREAFPDLATARDRDPFGFAPPAGESLGAAHARVHRALEEIAALHPRETVLVITHRGPLRMFVAGILAVPNERALDLRFDNASLSICESFPRASTIVTLNDTCHLRGLL